MKTLAIRTVAALIYASLAFVAAYAVFFADDSALLAVGFFAWNVACAVLFAYAVARVSGQGAAFVVLVALLGALLQVATIGVMVAGALGQTLGIALLRLPGTLIDTMASQPILYLAWVGVPVLAAGMVVYFQWGQVKR